MLRSNRVARMTRALLIGAAWLAGALFPSFAAYAATTPPARYAVEVLVFRYTGADAAQGELWPPVVPAPATAGAVAPAAGTRGVAALAAPSQAMAAAQRRLAAAAGYAVVDTFAWSQPQNPPAHAVAVAVNFPPAAASAAAPVRLAGVATVVTANNKPNVALHLRLCEPPPPGLELQWPAAVGSAPQAASAMAALSVLAPAALPAPASLAPPAAAGPLQCFALNQRRFVVAGQLAYFDNPAFGALVLVREIKSPQ